MKNITPFTLEPVLPKRSAFALNLIVIGGLLLFSTGFAACGRIFEKYTPTKPSVLPHDMKSADADADILKETSLVITVNDDSGVSVVDEKQLTRDQLGV